MAMSLRPISFHCSNTASEGLSAGFGSGFFAPMSCALTGSATRHTAKRSAANRGILLIFSLLLISWVRAVISDARADGKACGARKGKKAGCKDYQDPTQLPETAATG